MHRSSPSSQGDPSGANTSRPDIEAFVAAAARNDPSEEALNAFLERFREGGIPAQQLSHLSLALRSSGDLVPLPPDPRPTASYASLGGINDKLSLLLPPVLAALGVRVPVLCDSLPEGPPRPARLLASVPGFEPCLSRDRFAAVLEEVGCAIAAAPPGSMPAAEALGRLGSDPFVRAASSFAARLVPGIEALLLEVVFRTGGWVPSEPDAVELGRALMAVGAELGIRTRAILSPLDAPIGRSIGPWLEVREAAECLDCRGDAGLENLLVDRAARCLLMVGLETEVGAAGRRVQSVLASGAAKARWEKMLEAQGADLVAYRDQLTRDSMVSHVIECPAPDEGFVQGVDLNAMDRLVHSLVGEGGSLWAGVDQVVVPGEVVGPGTILGRVHARTAEAAALGVARLAAAIRIGPESQGCEEGWGGIEG